VILFNPEPGGTMTEQQNIDEVGIFHGLSEDVVNGFAKDLQRVWHKKRGGHHHGKHSGR
jgi:hypothetical protein